MNRKERFLLMACIAVLGSALILTVVIAGLATDKSRTQLIADGALVCDSILVERDPGGVRASCVTTPAPPVPTATITPTAIITPTAPPVVGCPAHENAWHAPADETCQRHHHGIDPRSEEVKAVFNIDGFDIERDFLDKYGELWQPAWLPNGIENPLGYIYALYSGDTCTQFGGFDYTEFDCVTDVLVRHHDIGALPGAIVRRHSEAYVVKACAKSADGLPVPPCGVALIPFRETDYGMRHAPYKQVFCRVPGDPDLTDILIDQPPYTALSVPRDRPDAFIQYYWVATDPNPIVAQFYPDPTNGTVVNFAWAGLDNFQRLDVALCGYEQTFAEMQAAVAKLPAVEGMQHITFQLIDFRIVNDLGAGEFFHTRTGYFTDACTEVTAGCIPYAFTANFPAKAAVTHNAGNRTDCQAVPCFVADTGGVEMVPPGKDLP